MERKRILHGMSALPEQAFDPDKSKSKKRKKALLTKPESIERRIRIIENTLIELLEDLTGLMYVMIEQQKTLQYLSERVIQPREEEVVRIPQYQN